VGCSTASLDSKKAINELEADLPSYSQSRVFGVVEAFRRVKKTLGQPVVHCAGVAATTQSSLW